MKINTLFGGLYGMLVGDACGVPYEFKRPESLPSIDQIDMVPPPSFNRTWAQIPVGTYSDDGAQGLCLASYLVSLDDYSKFDTAEFADDLRRWLHKGYMAVDGITFDVGNQTQQALRYGTNDLDQERFNGNGSLMRSLPVGLLIEDPQEIINVSFAHSAATHPHIRSRLCCAIYSLIVSDVARNHTDISKAIDNAFREIAVRVPEHLEEIEYIRQFEKNQYTGSGYVVDCLWTALHCIWSTGSYKQAIRMAIAFGNDTDTTACVAGGLAGVIYGYDFIPREWLTLLRGRNIIDPVAIKLLHNK